jgi:hypothetical protein
VLTELYRQTPLRSFGINNVVLVNASLLTMASPAWPSTASTTASK